MGSSTMVPVIFICIMIFLTQPSWAQNLPEDYVEAHNPARAEVGVPSLVWDETLAAFAQNWANVRSEDCALKHSGGPYGENIAFASWAMSAKEAVDMWVAEKEFYDIDSNACIGGQQCLHYTQVVWRNSTSVGCANVKCTNDFTFITCNYNPPGNYIGERPY